MEGRVILCCAECGRTKEISGEMPEEYTDCFARAVADEGWVPRPGNQPAFLCGTDAATYMGSETRDDEEKIK
jgi:hypothetical protein